MLLWHCTCFKLVHCGDNASNGQHTCSFSLCWYGRNRSHVSCNLLGLGRDLLVIPTVPSNSFIGSQLKLPSFPNQHAEGEIFSLVSEVVKVQLYFAVIPSTSLWPIKICLYFLLFPYYYNIFFIPACCPLYRILLSLTIYLISTLSSFLSKLSRTSFIVTFFSSSYYRHSILLSF